MSTQGLPNFISCNQSLEENRTARMHIDNICLREDGKKLKEFLQLPTFVSYYPRFCKLWSSLHLTWNLVLELPAIHTHFEPKSDHKYLHFQQSKEVHFWFTQSLHSYWIPSFEAADSPGQTLLQLLNQLHRHQIPARNLNVSCQYGIQSGLCASLSVLLAKKST